MGQLIQRMIRAAKLEPSLYEEVEADRDALAQAAVVVVLSSVATGIGTAHLEGSPGIVIGTIGSLIGWGVWALLTYLIGTKLLPEPQTKSDVGELLRTIGFSASPGILRILGPLPAVGALVSIVVWAWMLAAMVVAVRQALDYESTGRAIAVCLIGFVVQLVIVGLMLTPMS